MPNPKGSKYKIRPTIKQIRAAKNLVEQGGNVGKAMIRAGYTPKTAKTPKKLTESQGFKEIADSIGLTPNFVMKALKEDIEGKPRRRKPELELASKILGMAIDKHEITSPTSFTELLREHYRSESDKS